MIDPAAPVLQVLLQVLPVLLQVLPQEECLYFYLILLLIVSYLQDLARQWLS